MNFSKLQVSKSTTLELETKITINMKISKRGRTFESGKSLSTCKRYHLKLLKDRYAFWCLIQT